MALLPNTIPGSVNLPIIGSVSIITAGLIGLGVYYFVFRRKGRVTSKSTTVRYR